MKQVIDNYNLPKGKATGEDNITVWLLQCMEVNGLHVMTKFINKIYMSNMPTTCCLVIN